MIDENKLMEEVRQWKRKVDKDCGEMPNVSYLTGYISALSVVEGMIAGQPTIDQYGTWIPCSERLPKDAEEYHVTQYNKNAVTEYCDGYRTARIFFDDNGWWDDIDVLAGWEIIAWMPLPLPYREEKKDGDGVCTPPEI